MTGSISALLALALIAILVGAVVVVFLRNEKKAVPPREHDEKGAPIAKS